jgi:hypothetical protein
MIHRIVGDRMIDADKYEGHTPAPWRLTPEGHIVSDDDMTVICNKYTKRIVETNLKDIQLIADAPKLLAEVKELQAWKKLVSDIVQQNNGSHLREMLKEMIE